jgi:hypothetical protein
MCSRQSQGCWVSRRVAAGWVLAGLGLLIITGPSALIVNGRLGEMWWLMLESTD